MSKKEQVGKGPNNLKVLIFNIIIAACCIASILTLYLGDFMKTDITLTITKDTITKVLGGASGSSSNNASSIKAADEGGSDMSLDEILQYLGDDFNLSFTVSFQLEGKTIAKGAMGKEKAAEAVKDLIDKQVENVVNEISDKVDDVIEVSVEAIIRYAAEQAKIAAKKEIAKAKAEGDITDEDINRELALEGITDFDKAIDDIIDGFAAVLSDLLQGNTESSYAFFRNKEGYLYKFARIAAREDAESQWAKDHPGEAIDKDSDAYKAFVDTKAEEYIEELVVEWDKMLKEFSDENGNFSKETLIVSLMNGTGLFEEGSVSVPQNAPEVGEGEGEGEGEGAAATGAKQFQNMDDVKAYIAEKIMSVIGEDTINTISQVLGYVGYFLFFVMACWAYVLLKVIIKTIFFKNKTVGLFFPRMFGWMPHVFLVGLPMLAVKYLPQLLQDPQVMEQAGITGESVQQLEGILSMISISVSSLTWVSALCTVILLVLLFMYYPMRRQAKRARKAK